MNAIRIIAVLGLILSLYALYVKYRLSQKHYKPVCDISKNISCSKAFTSEYSMIALLPNSAYGAAFYALVLAIAEYKNYVFPLSIIAVVFSLYLAYISYGKQKNFCVVCSSVYVINILLLIASWP